MTRARAILVVTSLLALALPAAAAAGEADRLRRALEARQPGRSAPAPSLEVARFAAEVEARRAAFRAAAGLSLPPKAAARLEKTRAAYEAGHGRLLELVRRLSAAEEVAAAAPVAGGKASRAAPAATATPVDRAALGAALDEASALAARIEQAQRREPYSSELRVRAPRLAGAALPAAALPGAPEAVTQALTAAAPGTTDGRPIGPIAPLLSQAAAELGGALEIYAFVRNNIASELYHGVLKGSLETYRERSGNDADTASLLVELLRARGIPARFVVGTAEVPSATLLRLVGTAGSIEDAVRALEHAGIPHEPVLSGGGISGVRMARVWVEAYLPYVNYRGLDIDPQGKAWLPLDAAFKLQEPPSGLDVVSELGFDPRAAFDAYLAEPRTATPREFVKAEVEALLAAQRPGLTYGQVLATAQATGESLGLLPNTLPYAANRSEVSYALPPTLTHRVGFRAQAGSDIVLEHELDSEELLADRVTIDYEPFDDDDRAVVALYGGMRQTPPYLFEVRPILRLGGIDVAGGGPIGFGMKYTLRLELRTPSGTETVTNTLLAGNLTAIGFGGRRGTTSEPSQDEAAQILAGVAFRYLERWNESDAELARLLRVVPIRPTLSACFAMSDVEVQYAGGDPLYPLTFDWKGVAIDADFRPMAPVGIEARDRERHFALLSGLEGSVLEERVLAESFQVESVSTVSAIQLAHALGVEVVDVTGANADAVVPGLPYDETVKDEIRAAAEGGRLARVPVAPVTRLAWTGVGYILLDEETGEAAYQLQGGHSGGVTAPAVQGFPPELRAKLIEPGAETAKCNEAKVFPASLDQLSPLVSFGTVNKTLDDPIKVLVKDAAGNATKGACVVFTVLAGEGKLVLPSTGGEGDQVTVRADDSGVATVGYRLGKSTRATPRFFCEDGRNCADGPDADQYTQVGLNQVTASAGAGRVKEPFTSFALPDGQCGSGAGGSCQAKLALTTPAFRSGNFNLEIGGLMRVSVLDPYDNPLSNFQVRFAAQAAPTINPPPPGTSLYRPEATPTPGKVLKSLDYRKCIDRDAAPGYGDCAGEAASVTVPSSSTGAFAYAVIGDSPYSRYTFDIGSTDEPTRLNATFLTAGWVCFSESNTDCADLFEPVTLGTHGTRARRVNRNGDFIEAYPVGGEGDLTVWAVTVEEDNVLVKMGDPDKYGLHYRTRGTNTYKRRRLEDSVFRASAKTPGTVVSPAVAAHVGNGNYRTSMRMAPAPQKNVVEFDASHNVPVIRYLREFEPGLPFAFYYRVAPAHLDLASGKALRSPSQPWRGRLEFPLWGAKVGIDRLAPESILLADTGTTPVTTHSLQALHKIEPEEWRRLLDPWLVSFAVKDAQGTVVAETRGGESFTAPTSDRFSLPRGVPLPRGDYTVHLEVESVGKDSIGVAGAGIKADPKPIKASRVNFVMDANNDTLVDAADEDLLRKQPGAALEFWEGDGQRLDKALSALEDPLQILEEYVTLRVALEEPLTGDEPLFVRLRGAGGALFLAPHAGVTSCGTKSYLCDEATSRSQAALRESSEMRSSEGIVRTPKALVASQNDYIFRCTPDKMAASAETCTGVLELVRDVDGVKETVLERQVRFRPVEDLMSVFTARMSGDDTAVAPGARAVNGWAKLPDAKEAPRIVVFVHGYNVSLANALDRWFPFVFKRLYWAGLPLIREQKEKAEERLYMVGFTWAGNQGTIFPTDDSPYPPNEFNAMQSAVPFGVFLTDAQGGLGGRKVQVLAHSLGNMVVNEAITMTPDRTVKRYIMNEAALAAEAFATSTYVQDPLEHDELDADTRQWGYPDDTRPGFFILHGNWVGEWKDMLADQNRDSNCTSPPSAPSDYERWRQALRDLKTLNEHVPPPVYDRRWRQFLGNSAWTGVYKDVPRKTELINTYNPNDYVITLRDVEKVQLWLAVQQLQKPYLGFLGLGHDNRCSLFWAPLVDQDAAGQNTVWTFGRNWAGLTVGKSSADIGRLTRNWGERAYWFATRSGTAGAQPLRQYQGTVEQRSFEAFGQELHSYLYRERALAPIWDAYVYLKNTLEKPEAP